MYKVRIKKKISRNINKMPVSIQNKFIYLIESLKTKGPILPEWLNYSKLNEKEYHCHLSRKWVACWRHEKKSIIIEVYYAGSCENGIVTPTREFP